MKWLVFPLLAALAGCVAPAPHFIPYTGDQSHWPAANGALCETVAGMPFYHGLPNRAYTVIGQLTAVNRDDVLIARQARGLGADAVFVTAAKVFSTGGTFSGGDTHTIYFGNGYSQTTTSPGYYHENTGLVVTYILIRFQSGKPDLRNFNGEQLAQFLEWANAHPNGASITNDGVVTTWTGEQIAQRKREILEQLNLAKPAPVK